MADMPIRLYRLEVSKGAKLVLSYLWRYAGRDRFVWPERKTIACDLAIDSERTLRRLLGELRKAGVLEEGVEVRRGKARPGWWLGDGRRPAGRDDVEDDDVGGVSAHDERAECGAEIPARPERDPARDGDPREAPAGHEGGAHTSSSADKNGRPRTKMAALAAKNDRARTKMAAESAKNGRPFLRELPGINSLSRTPVGSNTTRGGERAQDTVTDGLTLLRRWRVHGGDPDGLGPWPAPVTPDGLALPQLPLGAKLGELLRQDRTPQELHQAVHLVAELVEAGGLPPDKWRATYVFSGWLEELVVKALTHRARRRWEAEQREAEQQQQVEGDGDPAVGCSVEAMQAALAESMTLRALGESRPAEIPARTKREVVDPERERKLLDVRIQVQAMAEQLGTTAEEVLDALGRGSMRELEVGDGERLGEIARSLIA